jgi:hypothetical protein
LKDLADYLILREILASEWHHLSFLTLLCRKSYHKVAEDFSHHIKPLFSKLEKRLNSLEA